MLRSNYLRGFDLILCDEVEEVLGRFGIFGTSLGDGLGYDYPNNAVWVAIFEKNSFDVVQALWHSEFGADRQSPVHCSSNKVCLLFWGQKKRNAHIVQEKSVFGIRT